MTVTAHVVARLLNLIKEGGHTPHSLSIRMGWSHARVASKLLAKPTREDGTPNPNYRQTTLGDVDEILAALGLDYTVLLGRA